MEKAKWKLLELPLPGKIVSQKQYHIPGGIADISAIIKDIPERSFKLPTMWWTQVARYSREIPCAFHHVKTQWKDGYLWTKRLSLDTESAKG